MPHNWVTDIRVLVCNDQTFIVQIKLAFAMTMHMFMTNFVPSPREVERKFFTGGYRCGFFLNVKVKSPVEILFGRGTSTIIAEVVRPFITPLFYFWLQQTVMTSLSMFTTLMFPMAFCEEAVGAGLRKLDRGFLGQGHSEGVPGLGTFIFDTYGFLSLGASIVQFPPGYWSVYVAWFVDPSGSQISNLKLGINLVGIGTQVDDMEDPLPGLPSTHITDKQGYSETGVVVEAWMEGDKPLGAFPSQVTAMMFTYSWSPIPFVPPTGYIQQPSDPPYGRPGGDGAWAGPPPPPKCGWIT